MKCLNHLAAVPLQALMEEIASFEERLSSLRQRGEDLVASCTDQVQAKISQQVQAHQQGTRDSYSAICSTAQRVSQNRPLNIRFYLWSLLRKRHRSISLKDNWLLVLSPYKSFTRVWTESFRSTSTIRTRCSSVKPG